MKNGFQSKYIHGAGPIPNDDYGDGHLQVDPRFSQETNQDIAAYQGTDGNLAQYEAQYGQPGMQSGAYLDSPYGLDPGAQGDFNQNASGLQRAFGAMADVFGQETASAVLEDLLRVRASQDVNGPMKQPSRLPSATPMNAFKAGKR